MLSKNNRKEQIQKQAQNKQRFAIKKFTVGVASVLIGFTFMGINSYANADAVDSSNTPAVKVVNNNNSQSAMANNATTSQAVTEQSVAQSADQTATSQADSTAAKTSTVAAKQAVATASDAQSATAKEKAPASAVSSTADTKASTTQQQSATKATADTQQAAAADSNPFVALAQTNDQSVATVNNFAEFQNALQDTAVQTIKLNANITMDEVRNYANITKSGIARSLTIDGNGQYSLQFGDKYINFAANTENKTDGWHLTLANMPALQSQNQYGLFYFYKADDEITLNNITTTDDTNVIVNGSTATNVSLRGTNKLHGATTSALISAGNLTVNGQTSVDYSNASRNSSTEVAAFKVTGNAVINSGASLNINSSAKNASGVVFTGNAGRATIDTATAGVFRMANGATANMNLGNGKSIAVEASDIDLQDGASLNVNSRIDLMGFRAYAPIEVADNGAYVVNPTLRIGQGTSLKVIRDGVASSDSALVAIGAHDGLGGGQTLTLEVNGGRLDLEDSAHHNLFMDPAHLKANTNQGWSALISMFGTSAKNVLHFNNPQNITLKRNGDQYGNFLKLEGANDGGRNTNDTYINGEGSTTVTPIVLVDANGSQHVWAINYLHNKNQGGDDGCWFTKAGHSWNSAGSQYLNGANNYTLTMPSGQNSAQYNDFLNHFSWWNAKSLGIGTDFAENNLFQPAYPQTTIKEGEKTDITPSFTNQDGAAVDIAKVPLANTDAFQLDTPQTGISIDAKTGVITVDGNAKAGNYTVPVTVTYADGTQDHVNAQFTITNVAQKYTPSYPATTVKQGQTATVKPSFTDQNGTSRYDLCNRPEDTKLGNG
ncbi:pectate lyase-like adhesive domain-containing protein [Limosilactobacillus difficilis]|uniref:pectate lyase-like adhesive domain-containing protein n=1 Tax=Limosilactobacillus difficilis TaxID=2991838 RepID=UPI0024BB08DF|nr:pectate lyase-like adhesive domain-containing protein [Limosilactobacillus difficilis]